MSEGRRAAPPDEALGNRDGIVRFAEAAESLQVKTVFGAELSLELPGPQNGEAARTAACPSASVTPGARLNETVVASSPSWWLIDAGADICS